MIPATIGWFAVHGVWIAAPIAGLAGIALAVLPSRRARARYIVAAAALVLMAVLPLLFAVFTLDLLTPTIRRPLSETADAVVGLPAVVLWRGRIVRAAAVVWIAGAVLFAARVAAEWRRWRRIRHVPSQPVPALDALVTSLTAALGVRTPVRVIESPAIDVPIVAGWRRSTIVLPVGVRTRLSTSQLRAILAHELAHVARRDYAANAIQIVLEGMLWFHPAARWISRRMRAEREYCCDDAAVGAGGNAVEYARALATLEDARHDCRLAVAAASGTLLDRIQRIVGRPAPAIDLRRSVMLLTMAVLFASACAALAMIVPPAIPLDARIRQRSPIRTPAAEPPSLPRSPRP